jgi:sulfur-oxidizing protein SoxY
MHRRSLLMLGLLGAVAPAWPAGDDPVESVMWAFFHQRLLGGQAFVHDPKVLLEAPPFAEDSRQVPIQVDARAYAGQVVKIMAWAELNPIPQIFVFEPGERVAPMLAIRIRVEQATPLRAAVLTRDGLWHIGSTRVEAAGGGCTAPSVVRAQAGWEDRLGQVHGARFPEGDFDRLRLRIDHPMDNGLVGGIPEFFLNQAQLRSDDGQVLASLELFPAVAENPTLSLEVQGAEQARLWLRDNNGNEFEARF